MIGDPVNQRYVEFTKRPEAIDNTKQLIEEKLSKAKEMLNAVTLNPTQLTKLSTKVLLLKNGW